MKIDHIHFFVEDAAHQRDWFVQHLGWTSLKQATLPDRYLEVLCYRDTLFVLSSPRTDDGPVAEYLRAYAQGVADVAIEVDDLAATLSHLGAKPQTVLSPLLSQLVGLNQNASPAAWASVYGWGGLRHTLIERPALKNFPQPANTDTAVAKGIDHIVLNVPAGELQPATTFYQKLFTLQKQQSFNIQTTQSGLCSQVLFAPTSQLYFNINEPTNGSSQIQTFLDTNHGAGIQHIALHSNPIVPTVRTLRQRGLALLSVPLTYYKHLQQRLQQCLTAPVEHPEWQQIVEQQILLDWQPSQPESLLLQIFSCPIFQDNHFFFEFIERRQSVQGFGEGNFLALYKAIETAETNKVEGWQRLSQRTS
ncbi:VOC family protein [Leptolyngbya cf. ectocarpi LEGE 11479]|uniref:VOC family protein n=1 Tax=Leptolyngbya cf. ectocarpi LEGE 11479 TaxID=1828722 RepID=A0A928ZRU1_LEPEC|nr:VOC family protein [Leptolyngbya ectocarpi]MBE9067048.1 VOC family protein [Leptolyngbya cf. ectocarpi LEGE 11479]